MNIGDRIKARRLELDVPVDDIAKKLNVNRTTYYRYESDYIKKLPVKVLEPLAEVLKTTPAYLMGWEDPPVPTAEEQEFIELYRKLESSNKKRAKVVLSTLRALLEIDEQDDDADGK